MAAHTDQSRTTVRNVVLAMAATALALTAALPGGFSARAAAGREIVRPEGGVFDLQGRGFGHGRGMSQWGAQGAAVSGIEYAEILATYYPGTTLLKGDAGQKIKVHITDAQRNNLKVRPADGLRVQSKADVRTLPRNVRGHPALTWRVRELSTLGRLRLEARAGGKWRSVRIAGRLNLFSPVRFRTERGRGVRIVLSPTEERHYRGQVHARSDRHTRGIFRVINRVGMQSYLRSVVPSESFPTWDPAALQAQSVAARTYALWRAHNRPLGFADICDTTACQVYHGEARLDGDGNVTRNWEVASTDAAITHTAGLTLAHRGEPALTEFSASNGGHSTTGDKPYLVAKPDSWDGVVPNNAHSWRLRLRVSVVAKAFPQVGTVQGLQVRRRDGNGAWGGRVLEVRVLGSKRSVDVDGFRFAPMVGLRHSWWRENEAAPESSGAPSSEPQATTQEEEPLLEPDPAASPAP